jgi:C4-type Zn-finger protein
VDAWESDGGAASTATTPFRLVIASAEDAAAPLPPLHPDAALSIPELDLQLAPGSRAVAGATTPAALLAAFRADLGGRRAVAVGESDDNAEWSSFWERFEEAETGRAPWTLVVGGGDDDF